MWEQIRFNQTRSIILVVAMGIILALLGYFLGLYFFDNGIGGLVVALIVWAILNLIGYFQGDNILLATARARKISPDDHPRLYNVVEEMKIASGLEKMPDIYIIDDPALNAFATGRDPNKASLTVTSGLLQKVNRDELQGVVGHEIGHIKNRDVLLMAMCAVLLGAIVILAWYASRFLFFGGMAGNRRGSSSGGGGGLGQLIIFIVAIVLLILSPIFAQLIYFAVSRRREYLADASSALYTRYPEGLASALEKIAASTEPLKSANNATAPMYIVNPFRKEGRPATDLTSTHPPISERIRILRSMAGASYADYATAYQSVRHTTRGIVSPAAIPATGAMALRAPRPEPAEEIGEVKRARETSNLLWNLNSYRSITCKCGTRLRLPPSFNLPEIRCPHCGRINPV